MREQEINREKKDSTRVRGSHDLRSARLSRQPLELTFSSRRTK